ncbi:MAG: peptidoglycan-binding domain-containing protein [Acidimicrobiales bacterium]
MADLQHRLQALDLPTGPMGAPAGQRPHGAPGTGSDSIGCFGHPTEEAVRAFQRWRGLRVDGACGPQTWAALVEAGYRLGDRLLYRRRPVLRGDDVAELQRRLGALGFDAGRLDGMFGDGTLRALCDFQRNVGIPVDGIFGRTTLEELDRLRAHTNERALIPAIREREELRRAPRTLSGRRVAVGHHGGLGAAAEAVRRALARVGADAVALFHPDGSALAGQANAACAGVYLGLGLDPGSGASQIAFYSGYREESAGGRRLAELLRAHLTDLAGGEPVAVAGMSVPELRETRMTAVVCDLNSPDLVVARAPELARALQSGLVSWAGASWD